MGTLNTIRSKQVNNGIFIALLLIFAAAVAAWWFSNSKDIAVQHPLTEASEVSLCTLIPKFSGSKECNDSQQQPNVAGHSVWTNDENMPLIKMDLISTRNLSIATPITSQAWLAEVLPEIKASDRQDWAEPQGLWSNAAITRNDNEQELLFEDQGIVVVMQSSVLDRSALLAAAEQASKALRKAKRVIASLDDAKLKSTPAAPVQP